ncbi:hypothetical protein niasHT_031210 [Heterodera trifolii]|uniref:Uncharacterized protein n=1 Tax=Heterodera trifolii TaxID=157864 RepID=A0ABD2I160_9BILA
MLLWQISHTVLMQFAEQCKRILEETDCREMGAFDELMNGVKRKPNESMDALADRVQNVVQRAYPGLTQNLIDEYATKHLIRALSNPELSLSLEMARRPGMCFDEFVALAARAESIQKATKNVSTERQNIDERNRPIQRNFSQFGQQFQTQQKSKFSQNFQPRENIVCYNCNEPGHFFLVTVDDENKISITGLTKATQCPPLEPIVFRSGQMVLKIEHFHRLLQKSLINVVHKIF